SLLQMILVLIGLGNTYASEASAQELLKQTVSLSVKNTEIRVALSQLEKSANVKFVYSSRSLPLNRRTTMSVTGQQLGNVLDELFYPDRVSASLVGGQIVLHLEERKKAG